LSIEPYYCLHKVFFEILTIKFGTEQSNRYLLFPASYMETAGAELIPETSVIRQ
jgi:hypothetical protein